MVDILINASRIKYDILSDIFKDYTIDESYVNFYIDFHSIIYRIYKNEFNSDIINDKNLIKCIVVSILNTVSHYRRFLSVKLKKNNRIFIIFNDKIPDYQSSYIEYGRLYYDRYSKANKDYSSINAALEDSLSFVKELCSYFEELYFIDVSRIDEVNTITQLMTKYDGCNIIYTKNELNYQLVNSVNPTFILYPDRDHSKLFNKSNIYDFVLTGKKFRPKHMTAEIFPIYLTLIGLSKRDVPSITIRGMVKIMKVIDLMLENELISNSVSIQEFIYQLSKIVTVSESDKELIYNRYMAISYKLGLVGLSSIKKQQIDSCIIDLYDQNGLVKLNDSLGEAYILNISDLNKNKRSGKVIW